MNKKEQKKLANIEWFKNHPNYLQEWREKNKVRLREKVSKNSKSYYENNKEKVLEYYAKRNSKTETKLLVRSNFNALRSMDIEQLFEFQAQNMKKTTPVSIGSFFFALKNEINSNK